MTQQKGVKMTQQKGVNMTQQNGVNIRMVANINIKRDSTGAFYHSCGTLLEGQIPFFSTVGPPAAAREAFKVLASTVLEVEFKF